MKKQLQTYLAKKRNEGFTILETMVAVFILVLSITGPMVFAQTGLRSAFLARDQITAFYLAQDIIETIKNMRDENGLNNRDWLTDIDICGHADVTTPCEIYIDTTATDPVAEPCEPTGCIQWMTIDNESSEPTLRYMYGTGEVSRFRRATYITEIAENREAQIVVEVEWQSNVRIGRTRIVVQENIYNWIPTVR